MQVVTGAVMLAIAGWCAARLVAPGAPGHGRALGAWHLLMAVAMAAMLLTSVPGPPALGVGVFAVGAGWALARAALGHPRGSHLRLAAASAAMATMLTPDPAAAVTGTHTGHGAHAMTTLPAPALVVLLVALAAVLATCVLRLARTGTVGTVRVDAACEALMAVAMAAMLLSLL
ncbi:DUF5134 domain-containing protein [Nocardioides sp. AX2bis]|uniref:DUF5134 domain-containing protein n=1 Tax=Nocardioides sp. AX2bis TaxID=2653157 RepID=UPI0012F2E890|nr:DUF5134 domain-containing protein [Nocardioides sp. AX2bis]VXB16972.1 conserved membrane hypothetical protein [Nocardioides sp. AX2bis]